MNGSYPGARDNLGHPYRLSAAEWLLRTAGRAGFTPAVRDFALALDKHAAFAQLRPHDAEQLAAAIVYDLTEHDNPAGPLQQRIMALLSGDDGVSWKDTHSVYQALVVAAQLAAIAWAK